MDGSLDQVLVVDDREAGREILAGELAGAGFSVSLARTDREALERLETVRPELLVTKHHPPGLDAIDLVGRVRERSGVPIVVVSTLGSIADCERAMRSGADRFLQFRTDVDRLGQVARDLLEDERAAPTRVSATGVRKSPRKDSKALFDEFAKAGQTSALRLPPTPTHGAPLTAREARELGRVEFRLLLERLVVECRGNIAEIGRRLEKDRSTVRYHLRRLGLLDQTRSRGPR